jgi:prepilin-type N-terminal cleavage/methylation domain-containing protein
MLNRKGFTLIELLIVVVIIGILAAIAIPKFANTKQKAIVASLKSDLRNLVTSEEAFFSDQNEYAGAVAATQSPTAAAFVTSTGNVLTFTGSSPSGWAATITNPNLPATATPRTCAIFVGTGTPPGTQPTGGANEGAPYCY